VSDYSTDPFFCSYPFSPGGDPHRYYCTYNATNGLLVQDHDNSDCPATAAPGPPSAAAHVLPRGSAPRSAATTTALPAKP
jgi:hypothetical protein